MHEPILSEKPPAVEFGASFPSPLLRKNLRWQHSFVLDDGEMKRLVRDLHQTRPAIYWTDLFATALVGWIAFAAAVMLRPFSAAMLCATGLAALALYRALCFVHEISHQSRRTLPGFETVWNLLVGYPLLMPSYVYTGVHQSHHKLSTYGTAQDPEYLPFASSSVMSTVFALQALLIPAMLIVRFVILTPIGFISPRFQKWLVVYASSLTMNIRYRREITEELLKKVRRQSLPILIIWGCALALAAEGMVPWRIFAVWFVVCGFLSFVNALRTLGAHAYEGSGEPFDRTGQLLDSIDTPGAPWTELWAPVGLRYHALHHYFPGIPYHNLPQAYKRIIDSLPVSGTYKKMSSPSLRNSLSLLLHKGWRKLT